MPEFKQPKKRKKRTPPPKAEQRRVHSPAKQSYPEPPKKTVRKPQPPRKSVSQQKRRSSLRLYYFLMIIISIIVFYILSVTVLFNLEEITITGESGYSDEEIISVSGLKTGQNIVRMNVEKAKEKLLDELIWLDGVKVEKKLPRSVIIEVEPAIPAASVATGREYYIISQTGRVLEKVKQPRDCVVIVGYEPAETENGAYISTSNEKKAELLFELIELIESTGLENIVEADMTEPLDIKLNYDNRVTVAIGSSVSLEQKLRHTREWLKTELNEGEAGVLRVKNLQKITFLPDSGETAAEPESQPEVTSEPVSEPIPEDTGANAE